MMFLHNRFIYFQDKSSSPFSMGPHLIFGRCPTDVIIDVTAPGRWMQRSRPRNQRRNERKTKAQGDDDGGDVGGRPEIR